MNSSKKRAMLSYSQIRNAGKKTHSKKTRRKSSGLVLGLKNMKVRVIRYQTHSCVEPSSRRQVTRPPGLLVYNRRCALISIRLRKRQSKKKKKNWWQYRLILPPKRLRRKKSSRRLNDLLAIRNILNGDNKRGVPQGSPVKINSRFQPGMTHRENIVVDKNEIEKSNQVSKSKKYFRDRDKRNLVERGKFNFSPMPLHEWKIVFKKKDGKEEGINTDNENLLLLEDEKDHGKTDEEKDNYEQLSLDGRYDSTYKHEKAENIRAVTIASPSQNYGTDTEVEKESLLPLDQWQIIESELPPSKTDPSIWNFPILPLHLHSGTVLKGNIYRKKYPFHDQTVANALFAFEIVSHKLQLHERQSLWKGHKNDFNTFSDIRKTKMNVLDLNIPLQPLKNKTSASKKHHSSLSHSSWKTDSRISEELSMYPFVKQSMSIESHLGKSKANELLMDECSHPISTARIHLQNPIVKSIVRNKSWISKPSSASSSGTSNLLSANGSASSKHLKAPEPFSGSTSEDEEQESLFADEKPKPRRRRKKSKQKVTILDEREENPPQSKLFDSSKGLLDSDIYSDLMKLYIPKKKYHPALTSMHEEKRKKKKRKLTGSKKREQEVKSLKEELLVSLSRNTAYWYEVTSRLQNVSGQPESKENDHIRRGDESKRDKKKLKAAVHKAFPHLDKSNKIVTDYSSDQPSESLPSISHTKSRSKFHQAAAAVVRAEKNYYSFLPPLNSSWSDTLDDLLPSLTN
ncbi:hypothetical protein SK128_026295, partial [Halocaridina rubra]